MTPLYRDFTEQAQIDAQYNPSLGLADPAGELAHYRAQAAAARDRLSARLNLPYGPTRAETLDIFPAAQPGAPVFVFLHGGYWRALSSKDFSGVALGLQPRGITTVVVDYALCPRVRLDEIVRQCRAALAWVLRHIAEHGGDPARVAVGGHSAGGHLGAMALLTPWAEDYGLPQDPLAGALLVSGLYDLAPLRWSYLQPVIQLDEALVQRQSPLLNLRACRTPLQLVWGGAESAEFERQSRAFLAGWQAAGNAGSARALPGAHHFSAIHGFESPEGDLARQVADFFR
ncbi:MAG: alpha/beta hydrolase [Burkholderiaceae bacterium]|nr:alpha/beta hydrolase [Burkholderiaceae bacterium]